MYVYHPPQVDPMVIYIFTVINKASRAIHILNFVKHRFIPRSELSSLYKTMLLPILEYCDIIYDNCTVRESAALEQVQLRAALVCTGAYKHTRTDLLLAELGWLPLKKGEIITSYVFYLKCHKVSSHLI